METMGMGIGMVMMLVAGNGGGELLDLIDTEAYWAHRNETPRVELLIGYLETADDKADAGQIDKLIAQLGAADFDTREQAAAKLIAIGADAKAPLQKARQSDDPEIALRAEQILRRLTGKHKPSNVRKLMAIRTLGEMGQAQATEPLKQLADSTEPFVAEYAARAIARIEGKAYQPRGVTKQQLEADLMLLPSNCGIVAQIHAGVGDRRITLDQMLKGNMLPAGTDVSEVKRQITEELVKAAGRIGNVRLEAATLGFGEKADEREFFVAAILRGRFDREAVLAALAGESRNRPTEQHGDITVQHMHDSGFIAVSDTQAAFIVAEDPEPHIKKMVKAIEAGKGGLADNAAMMKQIKAARATPSDLWAAAIMDDTYKQVSMFAPFDTMTLNVDLGKNGALAATLRAQGPDEQKVAAAVKAFGEKRDWLVTQLQPMAAMMPGVQKFVDSLKKIQPEQDGGAVELNAEFDANPGGAMMMPLMMMGLRAAPPAGVPAQAEPIAR